MDNVKIGDTHLCHRPQKTFAIFAIKTGIQEQTSAASSRHRRPWQPYRRLTGTSP